MEEIDDLLEPSMRFALECIRTGTWKEAEMDEERKVRILQIMLNWFEEREEYENCAIIHDEIKAYENF
jgi:protein-arginine kinase activator protein McsA